MIETIREFAQSLLGERRPTAEAAMASHLADLLDAVELEARTSAQALSRLDSEIDNVRLAIETSAEAGDVQLELRLAGSLWRYCWVRGIAPEGLRRIEAALAKGDAQQATAARARALQGGAGLAWSLGDLERAKALAEAAIPVAAEVGSTWDELSAHTVLGLVANNEGDRAGARHHHQRSLDLKVRLGIEPVVERLNLANVALDSGEYQEAQDLLEDVLRYHRENDNTQGMGFALINLGVVHHALGDHEASLAAFQEAHDRFEVVGFPVQVARTLQGFAAYEASEGRFGEAARMLGRAGAVLDEVGSSEEDFGSGMIDWIKVRARNALGNEAFEAEYAAGRANPNQAGPGRG
jgi:tetratricopeptide (TPR) repeat protein